MTQVIAQHASHYNVLNLWLLITLFSQQMNLIISQPTTDDKFPDTQLVDISELQVQFWHGFPKEDNNLVSLVSFQCYNPNLI
jgi:hypothetical protein